MASDWRKAGVVGQSGDDEFVSDSVQVTIGTNTLWIDRRERWVRVQRKLRSVVSRPDAVFLFINQDDGNQDTIYSDSTWREALETGTQAASSSGLSITLEVAGAPSASANTVASQGGCCSSSTNLSSSVGGSGSKSGSCSGSSSASCKDKKSSCTEKKGAKETVCCHPIANEFGNVRDVRNQIPTMEQPTVTGDECYKCEKMFDTSYPGEGLPVPPKIVNPTLDQYKYSGEALRCCQLPLGPIGGGVIAVAGDGGLRQWQVVNEVNHNGHVPGSFWAIKAEVGGKITSKVLQSDALYEHKGFVPEFAVTDHLVPPGSVDLLKRLPGVPAVEITAKYPVVEVDYPGSGLPVDVHMTAWNPCIPMDEKSSGVPVIVFTFDVTNSGSADAQVTMLNSQQNFVGWDGLSEITSGVYNRNYGGNSNALLHLNDNLTAIDFFNTSLSDPDGSDYDIHDGHFCTCAVTQDQDKVTSLLQYYSVESMWSMFDSKDGFIGNGLPGPSPLGRTWNGALGVTRVVPANSTTTFTFMLAWHFPHRATNWRQPCGTYRSLQLPIYLGNFYATLYPDVKSVLQDTLNKLPDYQRYTFAFRDCMFNSTLPWQLIDSAAGRVSPLRSPTCMWTADARLYAFEGTRQTSGCCPLNCTHVWNYEQSLANLWPVLEQTMRDVDLGAGQQVTPLGRLMSRTNVPLNLRPAWMYWENYDTGLDQTSVCVDGEMGSVLKLYREVRMGASVDWFNQMWPNAKLIMARWMNFNDQGDGTMKIAQPSTYDRPLYGVNTFIGSLYLCGLRAAEEMAKLDNDEDLAAKYHARYELGRTSLDTKCFINGQWYTQQVDPEAQLQLVSTATFVDCLLGQWWGYILQLGDILPRDHCQSTVQNIFARNHRDSFIPATQSPRKFYDQRDSGMVIAAWPEGDLPADRLRYSTECAWTGLSHYFAGLCIYLDQVDIGLEILKNARYCYDGTRRNPWNEIECGDHYSRPMSAFQLFAAASGITWTQLLGEALQVTFKPRIGPTNFQGFYNLPGCWGQYTQTASLDFMSGQASISIGWGTLGISQLWVPFQNGDSEKITVTTGSEGKLVVLERAEVVGEYLKLYFPQPVSINVVTSPLTVKLTTTPP